MHGLWPVKGARERGQRNDASALMISSESSIRAR
jgi:hypothetical protein